MAAGGKAYDRLSASTAVARGSGTGDTEATCCCTSWQTGLFLASATCCILSGRPLEGGATLFEWSGLGWIACLPPCSAWNVSGFESYFISGAPGHDSP